MEIINKDIVIVEWVDSVRASDWTYAEDVDEKPMNCISIGFLMKETDDSITIAQNYGLKPEQVCNIMTIPKCSIKGIRKIDEKYYWKPNDEQMKALEDVMKNRAAKRKYINSLYDDLMKLRKEQGDEIKGCKNS